MLPYTQSQFVVFYTLLFKKKQALTPKKAPQNLKKRTN